MATRVINLKKRAILDLDEIWFSIARDDISAADKLLDTLKARSDQLILFPKLGPLRADLFPDTRVLVEGNYLIFHRLQQSTIDILRIVQGARDLSDLNLF